jgi:putative endonuclease
VRTQRQVRGRDAEDRVARFLERMGCRLVARNLRVGRLEIDIVALHGSRVLVVEVRSRSAGGLVDAAETVDARKATRVREAAARWLRASPGVFASDPPGGFTAVRFDVAAVLYPSDGGEPHLRYYAGAF